MNLNVGVWPASGVKENAFVQLFADGLRSAGLTVIDVRSPGKVDPKSLDVFHIHWPEQIFWGGKGVAGAARRLLSTLRAVRCFRRHGVLIVWMVHNIEPHDMSWQRRLLWNFYCRRLGALTDAFITLSPATIQVVRENIASLRIKRAGWVWHPSYPVNVSEAARDTTRQRLHVQPNQRLFGSLGLIRPYKGIESLITLFLAYPQTDARLLIAGAVVEQQYATKLHRLIGSDTRIMLQVGNLTEKEFEDYLAAIDVIVLPFQKSLHSGSIMHAISAHRPVVTKDTAFAQSLRGQVGIGWITTYSDKLEFAHLQDCPAPQMPPDLRAFTTQALGKKMRAFYLEALLNRG